MTDFSTVIHNLTYCVTTEDQPFFEYQSVRMGVFQEMNTQTKSLGYSDRDKGPAHCSSVQ